jgi:septal ring factor EnvC (AmiA/AmiB activator)
LIRTGFICLLLVSALLSGQAAVAQNAGVLAQDAASAAADELVRASVALEQAQSVPDRITALTAVVDAFESGLSALRSEVRRAALREQLLSRELSDKSSEISKLLTVMQVVGRARGPQVTFHPDGALGTARAGMMLGAVVPALQYKVGSLSAQLTELQIVQSLQSTAREDLLAGLRGVQTARTELSEAISRRTDRPMRFSEDPVRMAWLLDASETLAAFASGLADREAADIDQIASLKGTLSVPVEGAVLRRFGQPDAAGVVRPGWIVATAPQARVTTPMPATVRYLGPFLHYGNVIILEPATDVLVVLTGMKRVFGSVGQVLEAGDVVGLMGGSDLILSETTQVGGTSRSETLYIEIRENDAPVDPAEWFAR